MLGALRSVGRILVPGLVFQSVITGGGFATGREIVEYCARYGVRAVGVFVIALVGFGVLFFLSAEIARTFRVYEYRLWAKVFLGRGWFLLDILFVLMATLVCAIVLSGAAEVLSRVIAVPAAIGVVVAVVIGALIIAWGRRAVVTTKIVGATVLTLGYGTFAVVAVSHSGVHFHSVASSNDAVGWFQSGLVYVSYNAVALPACLYAFDLLESRKEIALSALTAALLVVVPMFFVTATVLTAMPNVLNSPVPLHDVVASVGGGWLLFLYYLILTWTLVDTAVGLVFAIVERVDGQVWEYTGRRLSRAHRGAVTGIFMGLAVLLAKVGIIDLIARGYSAMAYAFLATMVLPMVTVGLYRLRRAPYAT